ncbi:sigma-E processing peptidase SpoIIGA [Bacillus sp. FJAT-50079]|uniref:sigma-E processing peptidase SpoIIGA n=1 Tax=Bacillus sp. FJAT-50079 TaxID=2833577 RepID=UPI001BCA4C54|nr:sigma-E processing peptidase SpoIIGA [Bacillus sp. FJAT-50079]MBS4207703.1 sigma-E processing peptidase SpoIIGA [Bacillus sp. FJAT-50079]
MVVYLDFLWLLNFLIDSLLLWMTAIFLKRSIRPVRVLLGGLLGSMLILLTITPWASLAAHPLMKIGISVGMVFVAFGYKRFSYYVNGLLTLYFATFLMGGILLGTHYFIAFDFELQSGLLIQHQLGYGDPISWMFVMVGFPVAWHFSQRRVKGITISAIKYDVLANVSVVINEIELQLVGLIDSGNQLYDPISKMPVMVIQASAVADKLPEEIMHLAENSGDHFDAAIELSENWSSKMRLIPATVLGNNQQLLFAFKPDSIHVTVGNKSKQVSKGLIVFTAQRLSADDQFHCIVHPLMVSDGIEQSAS